MRCWPCSSAAVYAEASCWRSRWRRSSNENSTGSSPIWSERAVTYGPHPSRSASSPRSMRGRRPPSLPRAECFARSTRPGGSGATGCRPGGRRARWHREAGPARPSPHVRAAVSPGRRRTRADPVPSGPRLRPDDGTVPRVQTEAAMRCERSARHRTGRRRVTAVRYGRMSNHVRP